MLLNLQNTLKNLDGTDLIVDKIPLTMGKALANNIAMHAQGTDGLKMYSWAKKLYSDEALDLDLSEVVKLKDYIETSNMYVFVKGQLLETINAAVLSSQAQ